MTERAQGWWRVRLRRGARDTVVWLDDEGDVFYVGSEVWDPGQDCEVERWIHHIGVGLDDYLVEALDNLCVRGPNEDEQHWNAALLAVAEALGLDGAAAMIKREGTAKQ